MPDDATALGRATSETNKQRARKQNAAAAHHARGAAILRNATLSAWDKAESRVALPAERVRMQTQRGQTNESLVDIRPNQVAYHALFGIVAVKENTQLPNFGSNHRVQL